MLDAGRPLGRLFYLLLAVMVAWVASDAQTPPTTTVSDTVYRADSTPAGGTLLISWPTFTTASGAAVAAGSSSTTLGSGGALSVALIPNANATPSGIVYTVVYQLDDAVAQKDVVDASKFQEGLGKIIDGTVECLNASVWAKKQAAS